jgi:hypothetical protein
MLCRTISNVEPEYLLAYLLDRLWIRFGVLARDSLLAFTALHSVC